MGDEETFQPEQSVYGPQITMATGSAKWMPR